MDVEEDLKRLLHARDGAETVPDPVPAIHAGIRRRRRNQRLQVLAAGAGVLVLVLGASVTLIDHRSAGRPAQSPAGPSLTQQPSTVPSSPSLPPPSTVPAGFQVRDVSYSGPTTAWALGTAPCGTAVCTALLLSRDGGQTWSGRAGPKATMPGPDGSFAVDCSTRTCVSSVRFATSASGDLIGYAFGPGLAITLDGGLTWADQQVAGSVVALEAAHGNTIRVINPQGSCPCSTFTIQSSPIGSTTWTTVSTATPSRGAVSAGLARQGSHLALLLRGHTSGGASDARSDLLLSTNSGGHWSRHTDPCGPLATPELDAIEVSLAPNDIVAALCQARSGGATSVVVSTDAGSSYSAPRGLPRTGTLIAASGSALVVAAGDGADPLRDLLRSTDAGRTWTEVATQSSPNAQGSRFLGFTTDLSGTWIGSDDSRLVRTLDGGLTWTDQPFR